MCYDAFCFGGYAGVGADLIRACDVFRRGTS
jgi:hypothetical protein